MKTALYRHFDAAGVLLYVGISNDALRRLCQHKDRAHWFQKINHVSIEWLESRGEALDAEANAIASEAPLWNIRRPSVVSFAQPKVKKQPAQAVQHINSCRIDGWYQDGSASHMLGWFKAMFPNDAFRLIEWTKANDGIALPRLEFMTWKLWAASEPDFEAADEFDRRVA